MATHLLVNPSGLYPHTHLFIRSGIYPRASHGMLSDDLISLRAGESMPLSWICVRFTRWHHRSKYHLPGPHPSGPRIQAQPHTPAVLDASQKQISAPRIQSQLVRAISDTEERGAEAPRMLHKTQPLSPWSRAGFDSAWAAQHASRVGQGRASAWAAGCGSGMGAKGGDHPTAGRVRPPASQRAGSGVGLHAH